uniref:uncharacterized protein LOC122592140 n=1 Tax=Erigeron canadensis TaxID=72917 RepID=UPI001CB90AB9|nr:uncharacterized protein LOC122592140 [Erigeron canadensis]
MRLKIIKNDKERVRVVCEGKLVVLDPLGQTNLGQTVKDAGVRPVNNLEGLWKPKLLKKNVNKVADGPSDTNVQKSKPKKKNTSGDGPNQVADKDSHVNKGGRGHKTNPDLFTCPWTIHVSKIKGSATWMVQTCKEEHKCLQSRSIKQCTSTFLAKNIIQQIEGNPDIPGRALQEELQQKFRIGLSKQKAQRAKKRTKDEPTRVFKRSYICLGALKRGYKSAGRELLGLDGAFMSGPFPGQVLTAVTLDSNNAIYPVAYVVVEAETLNSWTWFLECLGEDLDLERNSNFTFISDRQKGLIPALAKVFPCAEHRYCVKHIHENMKLQWRGTTFKNHLWRCATTSTIQEFTKYMLEFKRFSEPAHNWLAKIPLKHWSRSHFSERAKSDVLLNNMCEVLNSKLVKGREKPIIFCLEFIREYLMISIGNVCKVIDKSTDQCVVNIDEMSCTCRRWEITGIPCKHAIAVNWDIVNNQIPVDVPEAWVDPIYRMTTWKFM